MNIDITASLCNIIPIVFVIIIVVLIVMHIIEGVREEPVIVRGKIVDMDVNAHAHTTKDSHHASANVSYKVRFISDDGTIFDLSTTKSVFMRMRPGDYGDAHIKTIFRRLVEFEPVHTV